MSTHKHIDLICVAVLLCTLLLTVLFINGESFGLETVVDGDAESSTDSIFFTRNDRDGSWTSDGATKITLAGDQAKVSGGGAYVYDGDVVIAQAGRYVISGTLDDGSIIVSANGSDKVWLLLNGTEIHCEDDACLRIEQADKVFLTLAPDTDNRMSGGAAYSETAAADKVGGVLFSRDDLTINGSGSLTITAAAKHGVDVNDELVITGGSIHIEAAEDAIHANDGLRIENAALKLNAEDEGLNLQGEDALLYIASGSFEIESGGGGIKSAGEILIEGGTFDIHSQADGIHGAGSVAVTDGDFTIKVKDDGIHADQMASVSGGSVYISGCYEGIEAMTIDIMGGDIEIYPTDDGLNANGGGGFGPPGMFGQKTETGDNAAEEETWIHISGGSLTIVNKTARDADGIDSNGDILISGGTVRVSVPGSGSNNAIDFGSEGGGVCEISGGTLVACGASMMAENLSASSTQCSIFYSLGYTAEAETTVSLKDASGKVLLSYTAPCSFSTAALSCPEMQLGESYTVVIGDREEQITLETVNTTNSSGGGFGGFGGFGGQGPGQRDWSPMDVDDEEHPTRRGRGMGMGPGGMDPNNMSAPPDFGGETPDFSNMPGPPDFGGEMPADMNGAPPDFGGERPQSDQRPEAGQRETVQPQETQAPEAAVTADPQPSGDQTWLLIGAAFLVLAAGIVFAAKYKV